MQFSETLKARLVNYFSSRYKVELSEPQIEEFLTALAGFYEWASEAVGEVGAQRASASAHPPKRLDKYLSEYKLRG